MWSYGYYVNLFTGKRRYRYVDIATSMLYKVYPDMCTVLCVLLLLHVFGLLNP